MPRPPRLRIASGLRKLPQQEPEQRLIYLGRHVRPMSASSTPLLSVRGITLRFGGVVALDNVSFDVMPGEIAGLIGPNGAGKTTLFNCLSRLYQPSAGEITFEGRSLLAVPRHRISVIGIGRTFQNVALF